MAMILKCVKTGRLFFSAEEATEHAEAFGKEYANFDQVSLEDKVWICVETSRPCFTEADMMRLKQRDPDSKTFEEKTVAYLIELQKKKEEAAARKDRFFDSVDQKKLEILSTVKGHTRVRAAKALHFTKSTIEAAEAWISEHSSEEGIDKLSDEFLESVFSQAASSSSAPAEGSSEVAEAEAEPVEPPKLGDPNPPEIKESVTRSLVEQIMEMGFSELRAEKALYKTDNASLEHAINWLAEHGEDADIDLPLPKPKKVPEKPKLSKEEAEARAVELQKKLREKKAQEEKLSEKEKERMRIESTKMMLEANEKLQEEERKRAFEQLKREKEEHERHRAQLKEKLRLDYIERFGREPPEENEEDKAAAVKEKSSKDQIAYWLNKLKKNYKDTDKEGLKQCLATLRVYAKNLQDNPQEQKFKKLKLDNKAFSTRVAPYEGSIDLLDVLGFEKKEDCLEQRKSVPDGFLCGVAIKFIDLILGQIG